MKIRTVDDPEYRRLMALRNDAQAHGMYDLAIVYGWALMELGKTMIEQNNAALSEKMQDAGLSG